MERITKKDIRQPLVSNTAFQISVILCIVVGSFFMGSLWTKVRILEKTGQNVPVSATPAAGQQAAQPAITLAQVKDVFNKSFVKFGDTKKKLLLLEISDPSCPYCHISSGKNRELNNQSDQFKLMEDGGTYVAPVPEMKKLVDSGQASFAFIYYPGHGNGEMGVKALYCAFEKGKYWPVHDLIMSNEGYTLLNNTVKNDKTKSGELSQFLSSVFDATAMKACLDSGKYDARLTDDQKLATTLGVTVTPGFFVNATLFGGAYSYKNMETTVSSALGSK